MKKITLFLFGLCVSTISYGQQVLSQSVDNTVSTGTVACASNPDQTPGTGDEGISDNIYYRTYVPADFGFTTFQIMGAQTIFAYTDIGGSGATGSGTVRFYTSDDVFPAGNLTEIASQAFELTIADDGVTRQILLDTPVEVDPATEIIVAFDIVASAPVPDNVDYRIGGNAAGQNSPSYLSSEGCGLTTPTDYANVGGGFPDNHIIVDLVGDEVVLSVDDNILAENISLFPNPTNGDLNIGFSRSFGATNIDIINVSGQKVLNTSIEGVGNNTLATSKLANGVYFAQISNETGSTTVKFIKN